MLLRSIAVLLLLVSASCQNPTTPTTDETPNETKVVFNTPQPPLSPKELLKNQPKVFIDLRGEPKATHMAIQTWCASIQSLLDDPSIQAAIANGRYYIAVKMNAFAFRNTDQVPPIFETIKAQLSQCELGQWGPPQHIQHQWYDATAAAERKRPLAYLWLVVDLED